MKIAKKTNKIPKKVIFLALGLLVIGGAGSYGLYQSQQANKIASSQTSPIRPTNDIDYNPPAVDEVQQQEDTKTDVIKQNDQTSQPPANSSSISVTISRANQGGKGLPLNVRTIISGTNTGECSVELSKSGQPTIKKTFPIIVQTSYSTCQQADIAASDFSAEGEWALSVTASSGSSKSTPATATVTITK